MASKLSTIIPAIIAQLETTATTTLKQCYEGSIDLAKVDSAQFPCAFLDVVGDGEYQWNFDICDRTDEVYVMLVGNTLEQVRLAIESIQDLWQTSATAWAALTALGVIDMRAVHFTLPITGPEGSHVYGELQYTMTTRYA